MSTKKDNFHAGTGIWEDADEWEFPDAEADYPDDSDED